MTSRDINGDRGAFGGVAANGRARTSDATRLDRCACFFNNSDQEFKRLALKNRTRRLRRLTLNVGNFDNTASLTDKKINSCSTQNLFTGFRNRPNDGVGRSSRIILWSNDSNGETKIKQGSTRLFNGETSQIGYGHWRIGRVVDKRDCVALLHFFARQRNLFPHNVGIDSRCFFGDGDDFKT